jgi:hypothetical protein
LSALAIGKRWSPGSFDLVTACMSLQDMSRPAEVLRQAALVLMSYGRMVASVPHPCTDTPTRSWERDADDNKLALKIDRYFDTGSAICEWHMARLTAHWETPYWRHTLGEWSRMIADAGFLIRRLHEPRPTLEQVARVPELADCARLPYFLILDLVKA